MQNEIQFLTNKYNRISRRTNNMNIYDFTVKAQDGSDVSLADYKGKLLLVVNTATECGLTPQYAPLQEIYNEFKDQGFDILDFPCNQFLGQAPGTDNEIHTFCTGRFGITFPQFSKIEVNGENSDPLFKWLRENTTFGALDDSPLGVAIAAEAEKMDPDYKNNSNIKWNFTKFLIDREGNIVKRFEPTDIDNISDEIKKYI